MSSPHYLLCSTAGLQATTDTPDDAAKLLVRHLSEAACGAGVDWMIAGPAGQVHHGRFQPPADCSPVVAVADHVDALHGQLLRDAARLMTTSTAL